VSPLDGPASPEEAVLWVTPYPYLHARSILHRLVGPTPTASEVARIVADHPIELLRAPSPTRAGVMLRALTRMDENAQWCGRIQFAPDRDEDRPELAYRDVYGPVLVVADSNGTPMPLTMDEQATVRLDFSDRSPFPVIRLLTLPGI
jgi:hypothetical protein